MCSSDLELVEKQIMHACLLRLAPHKTDLTYKLPGRVSRCHLFKFHIDRAAALRTFLITWATAHALRTIRIPHPITIPEAWVFAARVLDGSLCSPGRDLLPHHHEARILLRPSTFQRRRCAGVVRGNICGCYLERIPALLQARIRCDGLGTARV